MPITLDGTSGITTPGVTNTGTETVVNLTTTGNTIIGDATTDTLTVGVTGIVKDASGNVGIGTASPVSRLNISDGAAMYGAGTGEMIQLRRTPANGNDSTSFVGINFGNGSNSFKIGFGGTTDRFRFIDGGSVEILSLVNGGNVGIGTTSPAGKLTVDPGSTSGIRIDGLHLPKNLTAQANYVAWQQGVAGWRVGMVYNDSTYPLAFYYGASTPTAAAPGSELMRIDSSANVGIGSGSYSSVWSTDSHQLNLGGSRTYSSIILANLNRTYSFGTGSGLHYMSYDHTANQHNLIINANGAAALRGGVQTATGVGIVFPATQVASADANTLDDYEEGTWTPSLGGTTTYNGRVGRYTKIGRFVWAQCYLDVNLIGTGSVNTISGLPFEAAGYEGAGMCSYFSSLNVSLVWLGFFPSGTTLRNSALGGSTVTASLDNGIFKNATRVDFTVAYTTF